MKRSALLLAAAFIGTGAVSADAQQARTTLDIYVIDVEGGNSTLFVSPSGESVLIDTGNVGAAPAKRDAGRIMAAAKDAGLTKIDHLITTHWHGDHYGGMEEVAKQIPIGEFIDHGPTVETTAPSAEFLRDVYPGLYGKAKHTVAKPGDRVQVAGLDWRIVAAGGQLMTTTLPGAGAQNPYCATYKPQDPDPSENAQSVSSIVTFGRFRVAHMGDLTWNKEHDLMCPINRVGTVDLFIASHHGLAISNSEVLVHALHPRVDIINNGTRKGAMPAAMRILHSSPDLQDIWQIHFSQLSGQEYTQPGMYVANTPDEPLLAMPVQPIAAPQPGGPPAPVHNGPAFWIKVSAKQDGSFTVTNQRNGYFKTYAAK